MSRLRKDYYGYIVSCTVCDRIKAPVGRSVPIGFDYCDSECKGFHEKPWPSHLWPGESEKDFGYKVPR